MASPNTISSPGLSNPAILLFGSLSLSFDANTFAQLSKAIIEDVHNAWLVSVVQKLSEDLEKVLSELPQFLPFGPRARKEMIELQEALIGERPLDLPFPLRNTILVPLVVLDQLSKYSIFARKGNSTRDGSSVDWPVCKSDVRVMGLCTGLLSSFAVSSATNWDEFRMYGAAAVRLGLLVGMIVDRQDTISSNGHWRSLSVAWSRHQEDRDLQRILEKFDEAYVSVYYDERRSTVTTPANFLPNLTQKLTSDGLSVTEIGLHGAFHSITQHYEILQSTLSFCDSHCEFQLPDVTSLGCVTINGTRKESGRLHELALRHILVEPAQWCKDLRTVIEQTCGQTDVFTFGSERSIPLSLLARLNVRVTQIAEPRSHSGADQETFRQDFPDRPSRESDIAVVGMACKVAGANDVEAFWDLLLKGESQHRDISNSGRFPFGDTPFRTSSDSNMQRKWYANLVDGYDQFDHRFFKRSARESANMDPQQRQMLQIAYQTAAQGGYFSKESSERDSNVGVFVGVCLSDYESNIGCHAANAFTATGNLQGFIAGKVSHFMGWNGPALTIDTACSSSLVAVHQACVSILSGECNAALAGGSHIMTSAGWFQNLAAGSFLSPSGQCKPFDAEADGYCRGEGVGAVMMKKLSQAIADGDQILGVIGASAVQQNQNGTPIFVPNAPSLSDLFRNVIAKAHVKPSSITVVEAHGTGTSVGDPVEWDSIRQTMGGPNRSSEQPLMVSSAKGLVGHLECTSGIISLIKMLLMINKCMLPPQASFRTLNPALQARSSDRMFVPLRAEPWNVDHRVGLINNYGASGSNASMIVMQAPEIGATAAHLVTGEDDMTTSPKADKLKYPFWLSGLDKFALSRSAKAWRNFISRSAPVPSLANLSYNLARQSDRALEKRFVFTAASLDELQHQLGRCEDEQDILLTSVPEKDRKVIFCFGGQVSTFIGLDRDLYNGAALLRKHLDNVNTIVQTLGCESIYPSIFERRPIADIIQLQTMLFALQYSCAQAWIDSGVRPAALVGHSFGELTALCVSNVLTLNDAIKLIVRRATIVRDVWGADRGGMTAVEGDLSDVERLLNDANRRHTGAPATIACYNGPRSFSLAGSTEAMNAVDEQLITASGRAIKSRRLDVTHAFHSSLVDPLIARLEESCKDLTFREPCMTLERVVEHPLLGYNIGARSIAEHMRNPVYFDQALQRIALRYSSSSCLFLEAGSNSTITHMASRALNNSSIKSSSTFHALNIANCNNGWDSLTDTTISLWKAGLNTKHWAHHMLQKQVQAGLEPLFLPPYQFDPESRHWLELKAIPKIPPPADGKPKLDAQGSPESLVTFFGYLDGSARKNVQFRVNTASEEYQKLLLGHQTIGTAPICPATMQISFVIEAIGQIRPELRPTFEPQLQNVQYRSPICANSSRSTWIEIKEVSQGQCQWQFEVFSTQSENRARTIHTVGTVGFSNTSDPLLMRQLATFERFFTHDRTAKLLQSADIDEVLANRTIYRIFSEIVDYGDEYRGLKKMVTRGAESAGHVVRNRPDLLNAPWFDAHLADSFCQLGGLWANCMTDRSPGDVYLANGIDQWIKLPRNVQLDGPSSSSVTEFHVFAINSRQSDNLCMTDVFVFDVKSRTLMEVILGIAYVKVGKLSMQKILTRLTEPKWLIDVPQQSNVALAATASPLSNGLRDAKSSPALQQFSIPSSPQSTSGAGSKLSEQSNQQLREDVVDQVKIVISALAGVGVAEIGVDCDLADLGIDSLAGMEMVHDIEAALGTTLSETKISMAVTMQDLLGVVFEALAIEIKSVDNFSSEHDIKSPVSLSECSGNNTGITTPEHLSVQGKDDHKVFEGGDLELSFLAVMEAFTETKKLTDKVVVDIGQGNYVSDVLPLQNELSVMLTLDMFQAFGIDLRRAEPGARVQRIVHEEKHTIFVNHLYLMIESETQIITMNGDIITRTAIPYPGRTSKEIYDELRSRFPDQRSAYELIYYAGKHLKQVLSGNTSGVKVIFGSSEGRELVSSFYADWPLNHLMYSQMEDFFNHLARKLKDQQAGKPLRILEMGAGTGGTTKRLVPLLAQLQIPVEYTFTDLAPSFVTAARKRWGAEYPWMKFRNHDIEKAPQEDLEYTQHFVLASNAVHATHSICESTRNIRKFLRPDGFLIMGEMTRSPYWVDIIFGLFEGWWLFDDGRNHALTHEFRWKTDLQMVGYGYVDWTGGLRPESEIERLILAAASSKHINGPLSASSVQRIADLDYRLKRGITHECAKREEMVADYVCDLTKEFNDSFPERHHATPDASEKTIESKCIVVTGATGGLGAQMVAEAAISPAVQRVICLNRRSKQDPFERQIAALHKQGHYLEPDSIAKLEVHETDLSQPQLGLPLGVYDGLVSNATHIVHNAWLMHSKCPVKRFEPQLRIMSEMLHFARDISLRHTSDKLVTLLFISSIATVGYHPFLTRSPIVLEERVPIASVLPTGYGEAKYICERMLDATLHQHPTRFRTAAIRLGQIGGSTLSGYWNPMEHISFMIKSSQTLCALPDLPGSMGWTPADIIAKAVIEIATQPNDVRLHPIYHVENPIRQPWNSVLATLADELDISRDEMGIISLDEWLTRVRHWPCKDDNKTGGRNPAHVLVDFLEDHFIRMSCGGLLMGTANARMHSKTLANTGMVETELIRLYVRTWKVTGFLV